MGLVGTRRPVVYPTMVMGFWVPLHYTHALLSGVEDEDKSPSGSPVRVQENTELLSFHGLIGTPQHVSLLGLGGKWCSCCVHSVNVEDVGLRLPLLDES